MKMKNTTKLVPTAVKMPPMPPTCPLRAGADPEIRRLSLAVTNRALDADCETAVGLVSDKTAAVRSKLLTSASMGVVNAINNEKLAVERDKLSVAIAGQEVKHPGFSKKVIAARNLMRLGGTIPVDQVA